ncbi:MULTISPECIES: helix-turn-helix transcriptional regulator [Nocardioides]|uniref:helix-turn-helix transcriptional regulator n=1 Tax=Nocardioides TaxID=1839 RepID=UPI001E38106C|nr:MULTISPECIES: helix-turn-helix domain-containing protein [unclassified Nocardioides]
MERLVTIADLAGDKGGSTPVPEGTWRYWRTKGIGPPSVRIGRRVFYRAIDVERWLEDQFADAERDRPS